MRKIFNKGVIDKTTRLVLRSIPLLPGPELYDVFKEINKSNNDINLKIDEAFSSIKQASDVINDLEVELNNRTQKLVKLKQDYEKYSELAKIGEEEAKALVLQLNAIYSKGKNKERIISIIINLACGLLIFIFGILFGPKITKLISTWFG